jgi:antirestriction protein ArdC
MASGKYLEQKRREAEDKIRQWLRTMSGPWTEPLPEQDKPSPWFNPRTRTAYTGSNRLLLAASGFSDPRFYTVSNIRELDLRIKEGEKPTPLEFWRQTAETDKLDENGFIERDADGRSIKEEVRLERPLYRQCLVYNASQLTGENGLPLPAYDPEPLEYTPRMIGESILNGCGVKFVFNRTSDSFYHQKTDTIYMPPRERFADAAHFYSNAIRHLAESCGQPSRLNFSDRDGDGLLRS